MLNQDAQNFVYAAFYLYIDLYISFYYTFQTTLFCFQTTLSGLLTTNGWETQQKHTQIGFNTRCFVVYA